MPHTHADASLRDVSADACCCPWVPLAKNNCAEGIEHDTGIAQGQFGLLHGSFASFLFGSLPTFYWFRSRWLYSNFQNNWPIWAMFQYISKHVKLIHVMISSSVSRLVVFSASFLEDSEGCDQRSTGIEHGQCACAVTTTMGPLELMKQKF